MPKREPGDDKLIDLYFIDLPYLVASSNTWSVILLFRGMFEAVESELLEKYTDLRVSGDLYDQECLEDLRRYAWRFVFLHEYAHIWHSHLNWINMYYYDEAGNIHASIAEAKRNQKMGKCIEMQEEPFTREMEQYCLTVQALEYDADVSAAEWLFDDVLSTVQNDEEHQFDHIVNEIKMMVVALSALFVVIGEEENRQCQYLLREPNGIKIARRSHPVAELRIRYIKDELHKLFLKYCSGKGENLQDIEEAWCEIADSEKCGQYVAGPEKDLEKHLSRIEGRHRDLYSSLATLAVGKMQRVTSA